MSAGKRGPPQEGSVRPEATPGGAGRSVALESTIARPSEEGASAVESGVDLDAPPGTDDDASFLRDVLEVSAATRMRPGLLVDGAYRIERQLGQGGMGVVFLARDVRLDRQVALKIHRVARRQAGLERLVREARAMAQLVHPNVVTVHDVGTIDRDVYVAMEFLDGGTMRQWMGTPRTWREVIALFVQAGRGLAAAHQAGFVHRDFKPDNILLGADGRVRVADFGLVRLMGDGEAGASGAAIRIPAGVSTEAETLDLTPSQQDAEAPSPRSPSPRSPSVRSPSVRSPRPIVDGEAVTEGSLDPDDVLSPRRDSPTATGTVMGTPAYMAPEQHAAREVGPAADQFAFCVSLWEALHGERPFAGESMLEIGAAVMAQRLRPPPRDRIVPAHVRRAIVRGLAVDPAARFPSMTALLEELGRDPAQARRRAVSSFAGAAAFIVIGGGALWVAGDRGPTTDPCAVATTELEAAWSPARRAAIEQAFVATGRPYALRSFDHVSDAFDRYAARWTTARLETCRATRDRKQSEVAGRLRDRCLDGARDELAALASALAGADAKMLDYSITASSRLPDLARCDDVEQLRQSPLAGAAALPPAVVTLSQELVAARAAFETGRWKDGRTRLDPIVAALPEDGGPDPALAASVLLLHGQICNASNDTATARTSLERAARYASAAKDDRTVAQAWTALMELLEKLGKLDEAEGLRAVTEAALARAGNPVRLRAAFLSGLGRLRTNQGRLDEARVALEAALALYQAEADGAADPMTNALNRLGILEKRLGNFEAARAAFEKSIEVQVELRGRKHPFTIASINNLGSVLLEQGDLAGALALQEEVLASRLEVMGKDDPAHFSSYTNLGNTYQILGRYDDAEANFIAARTLALAQPSPRPRWMTLHNLGSLALDRGDAPGAVAQLAKALGVGEEISGPDNLELVETMVELADAHVAAGEPAKAFPLVERAAKLAASKHPPGHPRVLRVELSRGEALLAQGKTAEAHHVLTALVAPMRAAGPSGASIAARAMVALARVELARRQPAVAGPLLDEARGLIAPKLVATHPRVVEIDHLRAETR